MITKGKIANLAGILRVNPGTADMHPLALPRDSTKLCPVNGYQQSYAQNSVISPNKVSADFHFLRGKGQI